MYIDKIKDTRFLIEVHFEDCNFYELVYNQRNMDDDIFREISDNLVAERKYIIPQIIGGLFDIFPI